MSRIHCAWLLFACSGLPLMVGWFSLNLPAGLSLYYFSNTVFTSGQQIFLRKLGGAKLAEYDLGPIELGKARRTGTQASLDSIDVTSDSEASTTGNVSLSFTDDGDTVRESNQEVIPAVSQPEASYRPLDRRCKRKKLELLNTNIPSA